MYTNSSSLTLFLIPFQVGWVMLVTMGSSPIESVVAAGNIFVGQVSCNLKTIQNKTPVEMDTLTRK